MDEIDAILALGKITLLAVEDMVGERGKKLSNVRKASSNEIDK